MRVCIGMALMFVMLLGRPAVVRCAEFQVLIANITGITGSNDTGTPPFSSSAQRTPGTIACCFAVALECAALSSVCTYAAEASAPEALPASSAEGPTQAPADELNTTVIVAPEAGIGALLGNNGTAIDTTIVQQLTFTGMLNLTSWLDTCPESCNSVPNTNKYHACSHL